MDNVWGCKDKKLRLHFVGSNRISKNPTICLKQKARKSQTKDEVFLQAHW